MSILLAQGCYQKRSFTVGQQIYALGFHVAVLSSYQKVVPENPARISFSLVPWMVPSFWHLINAPGFMCAVGTVRHGTHEKECSAGLWASTFLLSNHTKHDLPLTRLSTFFKQLIIVVDGPLPTEPCLCPLAYC